MSTGAHELVGAQDERGDALYFAGLIAKGSVLRLVRWLTARSARSARRTAEEYFARWGGLTFVVGRFVAGVRIVAWPLAPATGISYVRFPALDALAAALWTATWAGLGFVLGPRLYAMMERVGVPFAGARTVAAAVGGLLAIRLARRRRNKRGLARSSS
jgi:membrane protein DedA with SNARE-associated domain